MTTASCCAAAARWASRMAGLSAVERGAEHPSASSRWEERHSTGELVNSGESASITTRLDVGSRSSTADSPVVQFSRMTAAFLPGCGPRWLASTITSGGSAVNRATASSRQREHEGLSVEVQAATVSSDRHPDFV